MNRIDTIAELDERLTAPSLLDQETMRRVSGDVMILGAGGKMGPSLAKRVRRATDTAGVRRRVIAVSRFAAGELCQELNDVGVETLRCDLLQREQVAGLPRCENVLFLSGRKFGSRERPDLTWAMNTVVPANVALHCRDARIVVFSTGNVYPFVPAASGGALESEAPAPVGEYAQSCLGRERIFEYHAQEQGTACLLFRLNYAVDLRYGVLVDVARKVLAGQPIDLTTTAVNAIWQGDANSYALRALELCSCPPRVLNVTGPETISIRRLAEYFGERLQREPVFRGEESGRALLSNAGSCHGLLGYPTVPLETLLHWVAEWVANDGASLDKPTKFEVTDGRY